MMVNNRHFLNDLCGTIMLESSVEHLCRQSTYVSSYLQDLREPLAYIILMGITVEMLVPLS